MTLSRLPLSYCTNVHPGRTVAEVIDGLTKYSAEVQGHGPGQEVLQTGKRDVGIDALEPVGHYAVQPTFSDGHSSGIFSWEYLYRLGAEQEQLWQRYEERLAAAGASRDAPMIEAAAGACGHHH